MAQLRDLIVNGASRFLGVVMFNNETHFNNISNFHNNILLSDTSTLNLLKITKAKATEYTAPARVIGPSSEYHLEIDNEKILAKSNATTSATLYLNNGGGVVSIGGGGLTTSGIVKIT
jgi:hypothetical protein